MSIIRRILVLGGAQALVMALWHSGLILRTSTDLYALALQWLGPCPVVRTGELTMETCGRPLVVEHWCTAIWLWTGALILLACSSLGTLRALCLTGAIAGGGALAGPLNAVVSMWILQHHDLSWNWVHIPGTVIIYLSAFLVSLRFAVNPARRVD